jgi:hypothetical protein
MRTSIISMIKSVLVNQDNIPPQTASLEKVLKKNNDTD